MIAALLITNIILVCICLIVVVRLCDLETAVAQIKTITTETLTQVYPDSSLDPAIQETHFSAEETTGDTIVVQEDEGD